jgi:hypothetical protein
MDRPVISTKKAPAARGPTAKPSSRAVSCSVQARLASTPKWDGYATASKHRQDRAQPGPSFITRVCPATRFAALGSTMSPCSPRNVIVAQVERAPFAAHCKCLPIGREYRPVVPPQLRSGVSLRVFMERKGEGS